MEQLQTLIKQLEAQENVKHDYITPGKQLHFADGKLILLASGAEIKYDATEILHNQMAEKLDIPTKYYKRLFSEPENLKLFDENCNHWLQAADKNYLLRTFQYAKDKANVARALLSDRYKIIDNYAVLLEALEAIKDSGIKVSIEGAELSDTKMYLRVVAPEIELKATEMLKEYRTALKAGEDGVISGFTLRNSEVGAGAFTIIPRAKILACRNGMVVTKDGLKNVHLGANMDELGFNQNKDVMRANLRLIKEQVKHAVKIFLSKEYLTKAVNIYTQLGEPKIEAPIQDVIEVVGKDNGFNEERKANILKFFVEGGDQRRIGLVNAITAECQTVQDIDARNEGEIIADDVLHTFNKIEAQALKVKRNSN